MVNKIMRVLAFASAMLSVVLCHGQEECIRGIVVMDDDTPNAAMGVINREISDTRVTGGDESAGTVADQGIDFECVSDKIEEAVGNELVDSWFLGWDNNIDIILTFKKSQDELRRLVGAVYSSDDLQKRLDKLQTDYDLDLSPDLKDSLMSGVNLYGPENPLYAFLCAQIIAIAATEPCFDRVDMLRVKFKSDDGVFVFSKEVSYQLLETARAMASLSYTRSDIESLFMSKFAMDNGVLKNKQSTPFRVDYVTTMTDITVTDNSYVYHCQVEPGVIGMLDADDWNNIKTAMCNGLIEYVRGNGLLDKKGHELLELTLRYVFADGESGEPFISISVDPWNQKSRLTPLSHEALRLFSDQ